MGRHTLTKVFLTLFSMMIGTDWGNAQQMSRLPASRNPFEDPYLASHTWPGMAGNRGLSLFALAAQQRAASQANRSQGSLDRGMEPSESPYHQSRPGGSSAAHFFGRSRVIEGPKASPAQTRYDRYRHFFGHRGRELGRRGDQS